jgi:hypothetical protein
VSAPFVIPIPEPPPREAVLTLEQLAAWLQISPDAAANLNLPSFPVGKRGRRYIAGQVLDKLAERAA